MNSDVQKADAETAKVIGHLAQGMLDVLKQITGPDIAINVLAQALACVIYETVKTEFRERQIQAIADGLRMQISVAERKDGGQA